MNEKNTKDWQMKCRFTQEEKDQILDYCAQHNINISEFVRIAVSRILNKEEKQDDNLP